MRHLRYYITVQKVYYCRFGSRFLLHVKQRGDANRKRKRLSDTRAGKDTLSAIQRKRARAVDVHIAFGNIAVNVFGHEPVPVPEMERLRLSEQTHVFQKVVAHAQKKYDDKKHKYREVRRGNLRTICFVNPSEKQKLDQQNIKKKSTFAARTIFGDAPPLTWQTVVRSLGNTGDPWIYVQPGLGLVAGLLDRSIGGRPFREYLEGDLLCYVRSTVAPLRRVMLVKDLRNFPLEMQLAAAFVRARVQETLWVPLVRYTQPKPVVMCFSGAFAQKHKRVVSVAKIAARRVVQSIPYPAVSVLPLQDFWRAVDSCQKAALPQYSFIYLDSSDAETQGISGTRACTARTFAEFVRQAVCIEAAPLQ